MNRQIAQIEGSISGYPRNIVTTPIPASDDQKPL